MPRPKIAYITIVDPNSRHSWSGTNFYLLQTLRKHIGDVDALGPAEPALMGFLCKGLNYFLLKVCGRRFDYRHSRMYAKACAAVFEKKLRAKKYDLIVCPGNIASVAYLRTDIPIISVGDRTVAASLNYHRIFRNLWKFSREQSLATEKRALHRCALNVYPSPWAVQSARAAYRVPDDKLLLLPFGANIDIYPSAELIAQKKRNETCQLLFVGVDWHDKGGPVAAECLHALLKMDVKAKLVVVGCEVPAEHRHERIANYKFLSKNDPQQAATLLHLFLSSDIFILPTRVDAYGLVFCEASAYGIPSFGSDTGGVPGALHDGVNGFIMPEGASGADYATRIAQLLADNGRYTEMSRTSRHLFERKLNWDAFGESLLSALRARKILS